MGIVSTVGSPKKSILRTSQSFKSDTNSSLGHKEVERRSWSFSVYFIIE